MMPSFMQAGDQDEADIDGLPASTVKSEPFGHSALPSSTALAILTRIRLGIEASHAALDPTLPEPLLEQDCLPPEDADGPFRYWNRRKKYFLVIAMSQTDVPKNELPIAQVDGQHIVEALTRLGYQALDNSHLLLTGKDGTSSAIVASLDEARPKEEEATLVEYYTGHGVVGRQDLWLQAAGQVRAGDGYGLKVSDLIVQIRQTVSGTAFEGEVVLILDACYSGHGTVSQGLTLGDLGKLTTIITYSADVQESFSLNPPVVPKQMSAFTHTLLQGLGSDWAGADGDGDRMLRWEELELYAAKQLRAFEEQGALAQSMTPNLLTNYSEGFMAYRRDQVRVWRSSYREMLTPHEMNQILAAHLQTLSTSRKDGPEVPSEAQVLARQLNPAPNDFYAQAVKAGTEGKSDSARALFDKAERQIQARERTSAVQRQLFKISWARARLEAYDGKACGFLHRRKRLQGNLVDCL